MENNEITPQDAAWNDIKLANEQAKEEKQLTEKWKTVEAAAMEMGKKLARDAENLMWGTNLTEEQQHKVDNWSKNGSYIFTPIKSEAPDTRNVVKNIPEKINQVPLTIDQSYYSQQYNSLEEILEDMKNQKRHLTIMEKLHNSIAAGKYIQHGTE